MMKCFSLFICLFFALIQVAEAQQWKDIVPLKSTRADVEKVFGHSKGSLGLEKYGYSYLASDGGEFDIFYAPERCKGEIPGWNVKPDTVLSFTTYPNIDRNELINELTKNKQFIYYTSRSWSRFYINPQKGLTYYFYSNERAAPELRVTPKVSDNRLRCQGFPPYNAAGAAFSPYETLNQTNLETIKEMVDWLISIITKDIKVYFVVYSGENFSGARYKNYLQQITRYIRTRKGVDVKSVIVIDGGKRESFQVDIFTYSKDLPPPTPMPEL